VLPLDHLYSVALGQLDLGFHIQRIRLVERQAHCCAGQHARFCVDVIFVVGRAAGFVMLQLAAAVPICRSTPFAMAARNGKR
jgi:hypothetical protein